MNFFLKSHSFDLWPTPWTRTSGGGSNIVWGADQPGRGGGIFSFKKKRSLFSRCSRKLVLATRYRIMPTWGKIPCLVLEMKKVWWERKKKTISPPPPAIQWSAPDGKEQNILLLLLNYGARERWWLPGDKPSKTMTTTSCDQHTSLGPISPHLSGNIVVSGLRSRGGGGVLTSPALISGNRPTETITV